MLEQFPTQSNITNIFREYCTFFNTDMESALLFDRNFEIVNFFRLAILMSIDRSRDKEVVVKMISYLKDMVEMERQIYSGLSIYDKTKLYNVLKIFLSCKNYYIDFFEAYDLVYSALNPINENKDRKFQDLLIEFNNSLAHLLVAMSSKNINDSIVESNIKKAISHLHRGILDAYKEVVELKRERIKTETKRHINLNNKVFKDYYLDLRKKEASNIGKPEDKGNKTTIIQDYKKLAWLLVNE